MIFNDFQRFLGARPYRGVSRQNLRKVRKKSDTTPTEKPTGAPPKVGFQASSCPSDFRRTFCSSTSAGEGPILAEKVSAKSRTGIGTFFSHPNRIFPRQQCQFWAKKANPIHGQFSKKTINPAARPALPGFARSCPILRCHLTPFGGVPSRASPQEDVRMHYATSLKLRLRL